MSDGDRAERLGRISPVLDQIKADQAPEDLESVLATLASEVCDADPLSEKVADNLAIFFHRFPEHRPTAQSVLAPHLGQHKNSAAILIEGLLCLCGDAEAEKQLRARLKSGVPERLDSLSLERLLTAVSWQRDESYIKPIKALKKRLDGGRLARSAVGVAQGVNDFLAAHRKINKSQQSQIDDLLACLDDADEKLGELYRDTGVSGVAELRRGQADRVILWLQALVRKQFPNRATSKQLSFIRSLIKKLKLDDGAETIIAEEVANVKHIARLDKDQASAVIEFLMSQTRGK